MTPWYDDFFEGTWLDVQRAAFDAAQSDEQAAQIVDLLDLQAGQRVLDVPCGAGRIALPLARHGLAVTGVDFTPALLAEAREAAGDLDLELEDRDMRDLPWRDRFDAAINVWGSFGYFDDEGNEAFAAAVCEALRPGGRFLIDTPCLETILPGWEPRGWFEVDGTKVLEDRSWDPVTGRVEVEWTFVRDGQESTRSSSIRIYSAPELGRLLRRAGFSEATPYAGLQGRPFAVGERLAMVAVK